MSTMTIISTKERFCPSRGCIWISKSCVVVFIVVSDFEVRGGFVDIDGIVEHHGLKTFFS